MVVGLDETEMADRRWGKGRERSKLWLVVKEEHLRNNQTFTQQDEPSLHTKTGKISLVCDLTKRVTDFLY